MNLLESERDDAVRIGDPEAAASVFTSVRPRLLAIAHRLLKDAGEAEDVVQETWLRWGRADHAAVVSPPAFLAKTTVRLAINASLAPRRRRETPASAWLPATLDLGLGPESAVERHAEIDDALRLLAERLTPAERAVYLLRQAFAYPYERISVVLGLREDHARQLSRRAGGHLATGRRRPVDAAAHRRLVQSFLAAAQTGDLASLEDLLAADLAR
ncbi:sigma factor [Actinocorallia herbida]|nr:sigma factor [Actinocorallia herbida]